MSQSNSAEGYIDVNLTGYESLCPFCLSSVGLTVKGWIQEKKANVKYAAGDKNQIQGIDISMKVVPVSVSFQQHVCDVRKLRLQNG